MDSKRIGLAVGLLLAAGMAQAVEYPQVREGLWEIKMETIDNPGNKHSGGGTIKLCRDHAYDQSVHDMAKKMKGCTVLNENLSAGRYSVETRCTVAGTVITSKGVTTFNADSSAHAETHSTFSPAFFGTVDELMTQDQTYVGSCPAGMSPGDRMLPDGSIQHTHPH